MLPDTQTKEQTFTAAAKPHSHVGIILRLASGLITLTSILKWKSLKQMLVLTIIVDLKSVI